MAAEMGSQLSPALDGLSCLISGMGTLVFCSAASYLEGVPRLFRLYRFLLLFNSAMMGVNGAFLTGDIFNLFVFFEILLNASYALMVLGSEPGQLRETLKYLFVNMIASTFFLIGLAMLYRTMGTLNMADLAFKVQMLPDSDGILLTVPAMPFLFVFGTKAAIFPLYFWLPGPYFPPPSGISAYFGGILTKVGVYAIFRTFTLIFCHNPPPA